MDQEKYNRILPILRVIIFSLLLTLSVLILRGVVDQFFSEDSTFKIYDGKIDKYPTITICTHKLKLEYDVDFNITFGTTKYTYYLDMIGSYEDIKLEQFYSYLISGFCYKITRNMSNAIKNMDDGYTEITLYFNKSITYSELPDLEFYLTSEKNSFGAVYFEWMEGKELLVKVPKVSMHNFA